jgi:hypothetical protein
MKAGVFLAFHSSDLSNAGTVTQTVPEDAGDDSKEGEGEAAVKLAASRAGAGAGGIGAGAGTGAAGGFIGLGAAALSMVDDKTLLVRGRGG